MSVTQDFTKTEIKNDMLIDLADDISKTTQHLGNSTGVVQHFSLSYSESWEPKMENRNLEYLKAW